MDYCCQYDINSKNFDYLTNKNNLTMNLKSTLLALMLVISVSVFATGYYVTVDGAGDAFYFY